MNAIVPIAQRLAARTPDETNSLLVSSALRCGVSLHERIDTRGGAERPDGSRTPVVYTRRHEVRPGATPDQLADARRGIEHAMTPPTRGQIEGWVAELSVITARRQDDDATESLRLAAYANRLAGYPADVVRHALLVHRWRFFPCWVELADVCDGLVADRKALLREIERAEREAENAEARRRALPTEVAATMTQEEMAAAEDAAEARRAEMRRMADEAIAKMAAASAKVKAEHDRRDAEVTARMWRPRPLSPELQEMIP